MFILFNLVYIYHTLFLFYALNCQSRWNLSNKKVCVHLKTGQGRDTSWPQPSFSVRGHKTTTSWIYRVWVLTALCDPVHLQDLHVIRIRGWIVFLCSYWLSLSLLFFHHLYRGYLISWLLIYYLFVYQSQSVLAFDVTCCSFSRFSFVSVLLFFSPPFSFVERSFRPWTLFYFFFHWVNTSFLFVLFVSSCGKLNILTVHFVTHVDDSSLSLYPLLTVHS